MLRTVLVGLLAVSGVACKSGGDSPKSQPGVAAGKVVEVAGTVTVRHNDVAQPLATGATVEGDDVIETGADGHVIIELSHNLARWELGANKKSKVRESMAWGLAKKSGDVAHVEQDTAAAGRNAERSAADTSVSASAEAAPAAAQPVAPPPPPAADPKKEAAKGTRERAPNDGFDKESGGGSAPKAKLTRGGSIEGKVGAAAPGGGPTTGSPPPPPKIIARTNESVAADSAANVTADKAADTKEAKMSPADADKAATDLVLKHDKALKACLTKDAQEVSVTIKIAPNGTATAVVTAKAPVPAAVTKCIKTAISKIQFAKAATTVSLQLSR